MLIFLKDKVQIQVKYRSLVLFVFLILLVNILAIGVGAGYFVMHVIPAKYALIEAGLIAQREILERKGLELAKVDETLRNNFQIVMDRSMREPVKPQRPYMGKQKIVAPAVGGDENAGN